MTTQKKGTPRHEAGESPKSMPRTRATAAKEAAAVPTIHGTAVSRVVVDAGVLVAAADLIADQGDRERQAFDLGTLHGFGLGWAQGLAAGLERGAA